MSNVTPYPTVLRLWLRRWWEKNKKQFWLWIVCSVGPTNLQKCMNQRITAKSSIEAEFIVSTDCYGFLKFYKNLINLSMDLKLKIPLDITSQSAMKNHKIRTNDRKKKEPHLCSFLFYKWTEYVEFYSICNTTLQIRLLTYSKNHFWL